MIGGMDIQTFLAKILTFINSAVIPFLLALAFLFFLWNAARYFIFESDSEEGRTKASRLAFYGIGAFVFIVSLWGIVNLLVGGLGFNRNTPITPDYIDQNQGDPWEGLRDDPNIPNPRPRPEDT